jgi:hypothetical protein
LLQDIGIHAPFDKPNFSDGKRGKFETSHLINYWKAIKRINDLLHIFRSELYGETNPVQLWPSYFDLAFSWFFGNLIPGTDPADEDTSREHLTFGFSTGDAAIPDAYFYVISYPERKNFPDNILPDGVHWNSGNFNGAVLMYDSVARSGESENKLLSFFRVFQQAGKDLMK